MCRQQKSFLVNTCFREEKKNGKGDHPRQNRKPLEKKKEFQKKKEEGGKEEGPVPPPAPEIEKKKRKKKGRPKGKGGGKGVYPSTSTVQQWVRFSFPGLSQLKKGGEGGGKKTSEKGEKEESVRK